MHANKGTATGGSGFADCEYRSLEIEEQNGSSDDPLRTRGESYATSLSRGADSSHPLLALRFPVCQCATPLLAMQFCEKDRNLPTCISKHSKYPAQSCSFAGKCIRWKVDCHCACRCTCRCVRVNFPPNVGG